MKRKKYNYIFLGLSLFFISFLQAAAQENQDDKRVYTLGEIVVHGKKNSVESASSVHELSARDIQNSGAKDVVEALALLPGIDIVTGGKGVPRINVRGFRTRHLILLLDGIPMNSAYDQQFDASFIPVDHIEKIKVTLGPSSVLYGQGGAGGVINIITKKGSEKFHCMAGLQTGEGGSILKKASLSGGIDNIDFFIAGSTYKRDSYPLSKKFEPTIQEDGKARDNSHKVRKYIFGNIGYFINEDFNLGFTFSNVSGNYGVPGNIINDPSDDFASNPKYQRIEKLEGYSLQLAGEYYYNDLFSLRSWIFMNQSQDYDCRYDSDNFLSNDKFLNDSWQYRLKNKAHTKGVSLQPKFDFKSFGIVTFGLYAQKDQWESKGQKKDGYVPAVFPPQWNIIDIDEKKGFTIYSTAVEYQFQPVDKLGIVIGAAQHSHDRKEHEDSVYSNFAGANYDFNDSIRVKAAFQKNIRFPSLRQLYDNDSGNLDLKTERVYHYTAGLDVKLPLNTNISFNAFKSISRNFIQKDKLAGQFDNFDKYLFQGCEIFFKAQIFPQSSLSMGYSYLKTKDLTDSGKEELQYRPTHRMTMQFKYNSDFGLSCYVSMLHVAEQYYYAKTGDQSRKKKLNDYTVVNLKLTQKLYKNNLLAYLGINNVFDENYEQSYGLPQPGQAIFGGLEIQF